MSSHAEYSTLPLQSLEAAHQRKKKDIKKLRRYAAGCYGEELKKMLAEKEYLKRIVTVRAGDSLHKPGVVESPEKRVAAIVTRTKPPPAESSESASFSDSDSDGAQSRLVATG